MNTRIFLTAITLSFSVLIAACGDKTAGLGNGVKTAIAGKEEISTDLYYSGIIEPLRIVLVSSKVAGTVKSKGFEYGQRVEKGQTLFVIYSDHLQDTYRNALTAFLTEKNRFTQEESDFEADKALHKAKITSQEEFDRKKNQLDTNRLNYINAHHSLKQAIKELPEFHDEVEHLSLKEINKVQAILERKLDTLSIYSPKEGVALQPKKASASGSSQEIDVGTEIKKGENLVSLGDLTGLSVEFEVNEIDVNRIKKDQTATLTVAALPGQIFEGKVTSVSAQAKTAGHSGGLATFPVKLVVPKITNEQRELIRIGMNAKVSLKIATETHIVIPIGAVYEKEGLTLVTLIEKNGKEKEVSVTLGKTTSTGVTVLHGINEGDKILVRD